MRQRLRLAPVSSPGAAIAIEIAARKAFLYGLLILAALAAANLIAQLIQYVWSVRRLFGLVPLFDFNGEGNLPTLFSVFLLGCCSALLWAIGAFERRRDRRASRYWFGMSVVAAYVMVDEGAQIHEKIDSAIRILFHPGGYLYFAWVIPGMAALGVLGIVFARFFLGLERTVRRRMAVAALLYVSGGLGLELIEGNYRSTHDLDLTFAMMATVEETLEAAGSLLLLRALLLHAAAIGVRIDAVISGRAR